MKNLFLSIFVLISFLYAQDNFDSIYHGAIYQYNIGNYEESQAGIEKLIEVKYDNPYIYFVLGKIYRKDETYNHTNAILYLKKYINYPRIKETPKIRTNRMYASINLAYEYLNVWGSDNIQLAKNALEEFTEDAVLRKDPDFRFCYATVYNSSGFYIIKTGESTAVIWQYYLPAIKDFEKALAKRPELTVVANNLAVAYIRAIELLPENSAKRNEYMQSAASVLSNKRYKNKEKLKDTRAYFYEEICPACEKKLKVGWLGN